jgi:uncharacterized protein (DUF111 family)
MTTLYLDIFSGISGDMFVGAMIDLGVDARALERELEKLKLDGWHLRVARGQKANISGVKFDVHLATNTSTSTPMRMALRTPIRILTTTTSTSMPTATRMAHTAVL